MEYKSLKKIYYSDSDNYEAIAAERFSSESSLHFNFTIKNNPAYVLINSEILNLITKIQSIDNQLTKIIFNKELPDVAYTQYALNSLINEIKQTNDIERVYSTKKEISETLQKIRKNDFSGRLNGMINKYKKLSSDEKIDITTCKDIRKLYDEIVLDEVIKEDPDNAPDGLYFRKAPTNIKSVTDKTVHTGLFPEEKIIDAMTKALNLINDSEINYFISIPVFHYMFEYIHPFYDGNGRLGRFISAYLLSKNLNFLVSYRFSFTIKENLKKYYESFMTANDPKGKGDLTPFVIQFLEFIYEAIKNIRDDLYEKVEILKEFSAKTDLLNISQKENKLLFILIQVALFSHKGLTVTELSQITGQGKQTVTMHIKKLNSLYSGIVRQTEVQGKLKLYEADLTIINEVTK